MHILNQKVNPCNFPSVFHLSYDLNKNYKQAKIKNDKVIVPSFVTLNLFCFKNGFS